MFTPIKNILGFVGFDTSELDTLLVESVHPDVSKEILLIFLGRNLIEERFSGTAVAAGPHHRINSCSPLPLCRCLSPPVPLSAFASLHHQPGEENVKR